MLELPRSGALLSGWYTMDMIRTSEQRCGRMHMTLLFCSEASWTQGHIKASFPHLSNIQTQAVRRNSMGPTISNPHSFSAALLRGTGAPAVVQAASNLPLRVYPPAFASRILALRPRLLQSKPQLKKDALLNDSPIVPELCHHARRLQVSEMRPVPALFADMVSGDDCWPDAKLAECIAYARASKCLVLSQEWRSVLPDAI